MYGVVAITWVIPDESLSGKGVIWLICIIFRDMILGDFW